MTAIPNTPNREQWLATATTAPRARFDFIGDTIPDNVRSTCGFPSRLALSRRIGECWSDSAGWAIEDERNAV
jgi:hypothetical protein